jgi:hypothetical protein
MATRQDPLHDLAQSINGIVLDVDGVLTDGKIIYGSDGSEYKHFHVQDGGSLKLLAAQGIALAIITGRSAGQKNWASSTSAKGLMTKPQPSTNSSPKASRRKIYAP